MEKTLACILFLSLFVIQPRISYSLAGQAMDMGPKKGAASMDNGFLTFTHARIPRTNLLARFQTVSQDGKYEMRNKGWQGLDPRSN